MLCILQSKSSPSRFVTVSMVMMMMILSCSWWSSNTVVSATPSTTRHATKNIPSAAFVTAGSDNTKNNRLVSSTTTASTTMIKSSMTSKPSAFKVPSFFSSIVEEKLQNKNNNNNMDVSNPRVWSLLQAASLKQSIPNRFKVEQLIEDLATTTPPIRLNKQTIASGTYRTVWSTVTSDNFVGWIFQNRPSNVLGGPSWQIINSSTQQAENIVEWKIPFTTEKYVHMVGLAQLRRLKDDPNISDMISSSSSPSSSFENTNGYALSIRGLEFRYYSKGSPLSPTTTENKKAPSTWTWKVLELQKDQTLGNGVGTLEILYNDGMVRITKDHIQQNTYVHIKEPLSSQLQDMFQA